MKRIRLLAVSIYHAAEQAAVGAYLHKTADTREQSKIKMLFDFIFFHLLLLVPLTFVLVLQQDTFHLLLGAASVTLFLVSFLVLNNTRCHYAAAMIAVLNPMLLSMASSFASQQDLSTMYAMIWILSILLALFTIGLRAALGLSVVLCLYLSLITCIRLYDVPVFVLPQYSADRSALFNPMLTACYVLLMIRVLGHHYRNVAYLEKLQAREKQKQFSELINQNLTKQFLILKGLSRSGQTEFQEGRTELLDECFAEIERQCDSAIGYLNTEK
ncbi:hypothetical protein MKQ68_04060 [Chitinophaga horti]|uniref:7TM diverse intracellular signalling n=1 Tax=Chitinophaga horti TaxID=2920382 RepID=A0ABY6J3M4_9BACT|nr:hypothetical protein [Chitinophaga horti]UYQ94265.1 hypothetical protein MKQ68_04060 [Chitinophaga horti]